MDTDRNLLFGVLALQADLIDQRVFVEACTLWANHKETPLADLLVNRGWLAPQDRADIEKLVDRKLKKHAGDARAGLAEVTTDPVRHSLAGLADADVLQSLAGLSTPAQGPVSLATTAHVPESRDRYTLSRLHATGGIGRIWLARDSSLSRDVALKELRPERAANPAVWARFLKEAKITGQLEHPGIVPIYEVGQRPDDQGPFYTMRFIRGRTLGEATRAYHERRIRGEAGTLELRELLGTFVGVCNAVAYAHSRGVIHRDLKPHNVVLGDYGEVIVLDWGLARLLGETEADAAPLDVPGHGEADGTVQGQVLGTPAYMAPEQAEGRLDLLGPATDVYGLGAILYELLTGQPPFNGKETAALLRQVVHEQPSKPRSLVSSAPLALEAVCLKALAKKIGERYATAKELASEVQHFLADEPVSAYREPSAVRAGRWMRRHRTLVAGACAAGLMALLGLVVVTAVQTRANVELRAANQRERERFELAQQAIQTFHTGVSEDVLLEQQQFKDLRNKLLRQAAEFYGKLEELLKGQEDVRSRRDLGTAYLQLGVLTEKIGNRPEALKVYRKALAVLRELADTPGAEVDVRADVVRVLGTIGAVQHAVGDPPGALESYAQAQGMIEALAAEGAPPELTRVLMTKQRINRGKVLAETNRPAEALAEFQAVRDLNEHVSETNRAVDSVLADVATSYNNSGFLLQQMGKQEEALASYRKALAIQQKLVEANPAVPSCQHNLGMTLCNIGVLLKATGKPEEALTSYRKALAIRQKLVDARPAVTSFQQALSATLIEIGNLLTEISRRKEAQASFEKVVAINRKLAEDNPLVTSFQRDLAAILNNVALMHKENAEQNAALMCYRESQAIFQKLADADPSVLSWRSELAQTHYNIGEVLYLTGKRPEALASYRKSLSLCVELVEANRSAPAYRHEQAKSLHNIGVVLLELGKPKEALAAHRQALEIQEKLHDANRTVTAFQSELARSHHAIGALLAGTAQPKKALAAYEQALTLRQRLVDANPKVTAFQSDLANSHNDIGILRAQEGNVNATLAAWEKARVIRQKLADANPAVKAFQADLANSHHNIGWLLAQTDKPAEALVNYQTALTIQRKLAGANPSVMSFQSDLARSLLNLGLLLSKTGKPKEAVAALEEAAAINQKLVGANLAVRMASAACHMALGTALAQSGKPRRAQSSFRQAIQIMKDISPRSAESLYDLACAHALLAGVAAGADSGMTAAQAQAEADSAMSVLRKAVAAGYRDVAHMRADTDLDALRKRDDFKKLLTDLATKQKGDAP